MRSEGDGPRCRAKTIGGEAGPDPMPPHGSEVHEVESVQVSGHKQCRGYRQKSSREYFKVSTLYVYLCCKRVNKIGFCPLLNISASLQYAHWFTLILGTLIMLELILYSLEFLGSVQFLNRLLQRAALYSSHFEPNWNNVHV